LRHLQCLAQECSTPHQPSRFSFVCKHRGANGWEAVVILTFQRPEDVAYVREALLLTQSDEDAATTYTKVPARRQCVFTFYLLILAASCPGIAAD
jgi:hypothetical protein